MKHATKWDQSSNLDDSVVGTRVSLGGRKVAKAIAYDLLEDDKSRMSNARVSIYDADSMLYYFGQFSREKQSEFLLQVYKAGKYRDELLDWIIAYLEWFKKGEKKGEKKES